MLENLLQLQIDLEDSRTLNFLSERVEKISLSKVY